MKQPLTGRADFVRALTVGTEVHYELAQQLGFERIERKPRKKRAEDEPPQPSRGPGERPPEIPPAVRQRHRPIRFWLPESLSVHDVGQLPATNPDEQDQPDDAQSSERRPRDASAVQSFAPLAPFRDVLTRLRRKGELRRRGSRLDVDRLVADLSHCREVHQLPRLAQFSWGHEFHLIVDLARRLIPYRADQQLIARRLKPWLPQTGATIAVLREGHELPTIQWPDDRFDEPLQVRDEATVLALTDLGALDRQAESVDGPWLRLGRHWHDRGCRLLALVPCRLDALASELTEVWTPLLWERANAAGPTPSEAARQAALDRLLGLVACAVRIEPQLLRAVRRLFDAGRRDAGLESLAWQEAARGVTDHPTGAALKAAQTERLLHAIARDDLRTEAFHLVQSMHRELYAGVRILEVLNLGADTARLADSDELREARRWLSSVWSAMEAGQGKSDARTDFLALAGRQFSRAAFDAYPVLHPLWRRLCQGETPPDGYDPARAHSALPIRTISISHAAGGFRYLDESLSAAAPAKPSSSPVARLRHKEPIVEFREAQDEDNDPAPPADARAQFWETGVAPPWATDWGYDEYGPWAEFQVPTAPSPLPSGERVRERGAEKGQSSAETLPQRLRWIPPGAFLMGSPASEDGRWDREGPQHEVTITRGFWMLDAPVTQALWQAVMGENPSHFEGRRRPVEQVSWEDCQLFLKKLSELVPGIDFELPTEAQWEYACRAGTHTATYAGDLDIKDNRAERLNGVAWYYGNSDGRTHDVGENPPNPWGLYDMLGNVWEWCQDGWRDYGDQPERSGRSPSGAGGDSVAESDDRRRGPLVSRL